MTRQAAEELFTRNCVLLGNCDAVPLFKVHDIFGADALNWAFGCLGNYLEWGRDCNIFSSGDYLLHYLSLSGFLKVASHLNVLDVLKEQDASSGGQMLDALIKKRDQELEVMEKRSRRAKQ